MRKLLSIFLMLTTFSLVAVSQTTDYEKMVMEREAQFKTEMASQNLDQKSTPYATAIDAPKSIDTKGALTPRNRNDVSVLVASPNAADFNTHVLPLMQAFEGVDYTVTLELGALTIEQMLEYDVVFTFNVTKWEVDTGTDGIGWSDKLGDFITAGGYLVEAEFVNGYDDWGLLGGSYITNNMSPFTKSTMDRPTDTQSLGEVLIPDHPIMSGVTSVTTDYFIQNVTARDDATLIAKWSNVQADPLVAVYDNIVAFNFGPIASSGQAQSPGLGGDGYKMIHNAIVWLYNNQADPASPAAPTNLVATAGDLGALTASVSWNNPNETFGGDPLTELTSVTLMVNDEVVETINNPTIGAAETYSYTATEAGAYVFTVFATNSVGDGPATSQSIWIGEDAPGAPGNVVLEAITDGGKITWEAPTVGIQGGYINPANTVYTVIRMPDTVVAEDITETEYEDVFNPSIGNYQYKVVASNTIGEGGEAVSNVALLGAEGILFYEPFDGVAVGSLPAGWVKEGIETAAWSVQNSQVAGGTAPEMRLYWSPRFDGLSRLVTNSFSTQGNEQARLKFKHYLSNFAASGNTLAVQVSFDDGEWENLWDLELTATFGPQDMELYITIPTGKTEMRLAWEFNGDVYDINNYNIDNIVVEPVVDNDLAALTISGNATPTVGEPTTFTVTIQNAGTLTQTDYSVKLMKEGGVELASVDGTAIEFAETKSFELSWTPAEADEGAVFIYGEVVLANDEFDANNRTADYLVAVQPAGVIAITIGEGNNYPPTRLPFDFFWKNNFAQTIYYADEIDLGGGAITSLAYYSNFSSNLQDKEIKVWVGETELDNLDGGWIPKDNLTLVYDGTMNFPSGENTIIIPFDDPYVYGGGNLVIYTNRVWENAYASSLDRFYGTQDAGSKRTRYIIADGTGPLDEDNPGAGTINDWHPNTTIFLSTAGLAEITGNVVDADTDAPIEGVMVQTFGQKATSYTDETGEFHFMLLAGTYTLTFDAFGYESRTYQDLELAEDEHDVTTFVDFELTPIATYTVAGTVKGNDNAVLAGASVLLEGYDTYTATTGSDGKFSIPGVYAGTYTISISKAGYEEYTEQVVVDENKDLDITLIEIIVAPYALMVEQLNENVDVRFSWNNFTGFIDDFESYEDFIIEDIGDYILYDGDGSATYTFSGISFPNATYTGSYMIFNPSQTSPPVESDDMIPFSGDKFLACFAATSGPNNDWIITPKVNAVNGLTFSFMGKTYMDYGLERFRVAVSTTDANPASFEFITDVIEAPIQPWTKYEFDLSAYAGQEIHIAIVCVSNDVFVFMVDDLELSLDIKNAERVLNYNKPSFAYASVKRTSKDFLGYKVYLDGQLVSGETPVSAEEFNFTGLDLNETYVAGVRSVYTSGESDIETIQFTTEAMYDIIGKVVDAETEGALANVEVKLNSKTETTNAAGEFEFKDVFEGEYVLSITHEGYNPYTQEVNTANATGKVLDLGTIKLIKEVGVMDETFASITSYPNPFDNYITISNAELVKRVVITNSLGQRVMDISLSGENTINTEDLVQGMYVITLIGENGETLVRRMVKN